MSTNKPYKGIILYHCSGIMGVVKNIKSPDAYADLDIEFDEPLPGGSKYAIFSQESIGTELFFSLQEAMEAAKLKKTSLNQLTKEQLVELLRELKIDRETFYNWDTIIKFKNRYGFKYGFLNRGAVYLSTYYPVSHSTDDHYSTRLYNATKHKTASHINYFVQLLDEILAKDIVICTVPSHNPENKMPGMRVIVEKVAENGRVDATSCLVRFKLIDKLATGGSRDVDVHLDSIRVENRRKIERQEILLLDDIATTGNTLEACTRILYENGAKQVRCLVLGRTYKRYS